MAGLGAARLGGARLGRQGEAGRGQAGRGRAWQGVAGRARCGVAGRGLARHGVAGMAGQGSARRGAAGQAWKYPLTSRIDFWLVSFEEMKNMKKKIISKLISYFTFKKCASIKEMEEKRNNQILKARVQKLKLWNDKIEGKDKL